MKSRIFIGLWSVVFFTYTLSAAITIMAQEPIKETQLAPSATNATGAEDALKVNFTSSTQYLWYQDLLGPDKEKEIQDVAQYLRVNVTGLDKEGKINLYAYGRATQQVWMNTDQEMQGRLYYFYLDYD